MEHVFDSGLRRERKRFVRVNPESTLLDVRKESIWWVDEGFHYEMRETSNSVPVPSALQYRVQGQIGSSGPSEANASELMELKKKLCEPSKNSLIDLLKVYSDSTVQKG